MWLACESQRPSFFCSTCCLFFCGNFPQRNVVSPNTRPHFNRHTRTEWDQESCKNKSSFGLFEKFSSCLSRKTTDTPVTDTGQCWNWRNEGWEGTRDSSHEWFMQWHLFTCCEWWEERFCERRTDKGRVSERSRAAWSSVGVCRTDCRMHSQLQMYKAVWCHSHTTNINPSLTHTNTVVRECTVTDSWEFQRRVKSDNLPTYTSHYTSLVSLLSCSHFSFTDT